MNQDKKTARKRAKEAAEALRDRRAELDGSIFENFLRLPEYESADAIFFYYSVGDEPDTHRLIDHSLSLGKRVALPRTYPDGKMEAFEIYDTNELVEGRFGIAEPPENAPKMEREDFSVIVVPAVAFDKNGGRLGHGAGYYDRYLAGSDVFTVGLAADGLVLDSAPCDAHDIRVMCIVTEKGIARP